MDALWRRVEPAPVTCILFRAAALVLGDYWNTQEPHFINAFRCSAALKAWYPLIRLGCTITPCTMRLEAAGSASSRPIVYSLHDTRHRDRISVTDAADGCENMGGPNINQPSSLEMNDKQSKSIISPPLKYPVAVHAPVQPPIFSLSRLKTRWPSSFDRLL